MEHSEQIKIWFRATLQKTLESNLRKTQNSQNGCIEIVTNLPLSPISQLKFQKNSLRQKRHGLERRRQINLRFRQKRRKDRYSSWRQRGPSQKIVSIYTIYQQLSSHWLCKTRKRTEVTKFSFIFTNNQPTFRLNDSRESKLNLRWTLLPHDSDPGVKKSR